MKISRLLKRFKLNSKGMSLVEVIVAVAVFCVVAVPTMQIFASSANTNLDSRLRQRATLVGESVMESFKAYDMEALCKQFRGKAFGGVTPNPSGSTTMEVKGMIGLTEAASVFRKDDTLNRDISQFIFRANDVISEGQRYDVVVEATPVAEPVVLRMDSPNKYSDAIIKFDSSFNNRIAGEIIKKAKTVFLAAKSECTESDITDVEISDFVRTFTIGVTDDGAAQKVTLKVKCSAKAKVSYQITTGGVLGSSSYTIPASDLSLDVNLPEATDTTTEITVYDNTNTIAGTMIEGKHCKLNQIYLFYCPAYKTFFGSGAQDEIVLEGALTSLYDPAVSTEPEAEGYMPLRLNVTKQRYTGVSSTELNLEEISYKAKVTANLSGGGEAVLVSNFDRNVSGEGGVIAPVPTTGFSEIKTYTDGFTGEVELLYDLVVHVYEHEDGVDDSLKKEVATFTGTKND